MSKSVDHQKYRIAPGKTVVLADRQTREHRDWDEKAAKKRWKKNIKTLKDYQERLFAESKQSLLLVLQAMDTGGKDSTIKKIVGDLNPQGVRVFGFKAPSKEELSHDFLWRIHDHAPDKGRIAIFNRSHYEDVLIVRVHGLAPQKLVEKRYQHINDFERLLADHGTRVVKVMLHISKDYQLERLRSRLKNPDKHWKFNPGDLNERNHWDDYMRAYEIALSRCSTEYAPWYVIPAEHRWFRDLLISDILIQTFNEMNPKFPEPDFNIEDYPPESLK